MGEKIKVLSNYGGIDIELNKATIINGPRYIHLQNKHGRLCITEDEYKQLAICLLKSKERFLHYKQKGIGELK